MPATLAWNFTIESPERAWEPFLDWMRSQGLDPTLCRELHITGEGQAEVVEYLLNARGRRYAIGGEPATRTRTVTISTPPPLHPSRSAG